MRVPGFEINDRHLVLGLAATYVAGVLIVLSVLIYHTVWHAVYVGL